MAVLDRAELERSPLADLHAIASELGIEGYRRLRRDDLIDQILGGGGGDAEDEGGARAGGGSGSRSGGGRGRGRSRSGNGAATASDDADEDRAERRPRRRGGRGRTRRSSETDLTADEAAPAAEAADLEPDDDGAQAEPEPGDEPRSGVLDILPNGSGFMRAEAYAHSREDVYVSPAQIRRCELRAGDELAGSVRAPRRNERHPSLVRVDTVNGAPAEPPAERPRFEDLTPVFATERLTSPDGLDDVPFGKGSRVALGGPPGAGITTLLRRIALSVAAAHPELEVIVVLAGVRPEEVTEWRRDSSIEVAGGGFDRPVDEQAQAAELAAERAKRAVEAGRDAVLIVDGLDALPPGVGRRVFGAARKAEEGGSLTVVASTGAAGEPLRVATTRILLERPDTPGPQPPKLAPGSGTLRADLLG